MPPLLSLTVRQDAIDVVAEVREDPIPIHLDPAATGGEPVSEQDGRLQCAVRVDVEDGARAIEGTATVVPGEE